MKQNLNCIRKWKSIAAVAIFVAALAGCEKDLYEGQIHQEKMIHRPISLDEITRSGNIKLLSAMERIRAKKSESANGKIVYDSVNKIWFDDEKGLYIKSDTLESYTFEVYDLEVDTDYLKNVVFSLKADGEFEVIMTKYDFTRKEFATVDKAELALRDVMYTQVEAGRIKLVHVCSESQTWQASNSTYPVCNLPAGHVHSNGEACNQMTWVTTGTACEWLLTGNPDTGGGSSSSGGSGSSASGGSGGGGIITGPWVASAAQTRLSNFTHGLQTVGLHSTWASLTQEVQATFINYLENPVNGFLPTTTFNALNVAYVHQLLQQMSLTGLTLNPVASKDSPMFIDTSAISGNSPEEVQLRSIMTILKNSPVYRNLFYNMFNETAILNVRFEIADLGLNVHGNCTAMVNVPGYVYNLIKMDRSQLINQSAVESARTLLHEMIHAYLNVKKYNNGLGATPADLNGVNFADCLSGYYADLPTQVAHDFMSEHMISTMVSVLMEIRDLVLTPSQIYSVENPTNGAAFLYEPLDLMTQSISDIQVPWNWNQYFTELSFDGLQNCILFPTFYPPYSIQMYYHIKYLQIGNAMF